jgi:hypothetical protein
LAAAADDPVGPSVGDDLDAAVQVGAVDRQSGHFLQVLQGGPMGVTVLVVDAGRNDGHGRLDERQEGIGRS